MKKEKHSKCKHDHSSKKNSLHIHNVEKNKKFEEDKCTHNSTESNNKLWKFIKKIFIMLGWIVIHDHSHDKNLIGHNHENHNHESFQTKKWILVIGLILAGWAIFVMIYSLLHSQLGWIWDSDFFIIINNEWLKFVIGTIGMFLIGISFLIGSTTSLMKKQIAEDTLVAVATTSIYFLSILGMILGWEEYLLFYEVVEILALIYLGRFIEEWLTNKVSKEMNSLDSLKPKDAIIIRGGKEVSINVNEIVLGDILIIKPGAIVPVDGIIITGSTTIDESSLTGESTPIFKVKGSTVFSGTISSNGLIKIKATKLIEDSFISKIINGVSKAAEAKPKTQRLADKIAGILVPLVLVIALVTLLTIGFTDNWSRAIQGTMTVMVIACPCSFAMITPIGVLVGSTIAKKEGVIFNSKKTFEIIKDINVICFDKTGTLTEGKFKIIDSSLPKTAIQKLVDIENTSTHPLAHSIVNHFNKIQPKSIKTVEVLGKGLKSGNIYVGSHKFVKDLHPKFIEIKEIIKKRNSGSVFIYMFNKKEIIGHIEMKDQIKDSTLETLSSLRNMGLDVVMITGDQHNTANSIASSIGIKPENVYSEVNPEDKANIIKELQQKGLHVAFVGDGINDSVALTQSDLGIAMGEGSDAAIESADIVLSKNDLTLVSYSIFLSRKTIFNIRRGFSIAVAYNLVAIPIGATGFIPPVFGALSMIFNDSIAMVNAMTLTNAKKKKFTKKYNKN
ncbi:MAG: cation-translocating P-type ATPase [Mycoplasmataceae bacterium]|nr:cation-translocating P-type ATPase [Mycoplasmataceae bacterium]